MGKDLGLVVGLLILAMDISAGIISIQAERDQNKMKHTRTTKSHCRDLSHPAFSLGIAAAVILAFTHFMANFLGGCHCFRSKQEYIRASSNKMLALICLIFSWILLGVGFSLLIIGTLANSRSRKFCGLPRHEIFLIGGVFCFLHGIFTVSYYVSATAAAREEERKHTADANRKGITHA